ncbi:hypothetical protein [Streptomyces sp. NPDC093149]|uniref:hypothetical protein n=1 Tax=Streptomyces sp. NPDC093149 TaxID=3366031 RepID=UPI003803D19F
MPKAPIHAENVTASSVGKETKEFGKPAAVVIGGAPGDGLMPPFTPTAHAPGILNPGVCVGKPPEYSDIALINTMPMTAISG